MVAGQTVERACGTCSLCCDLPEIDAFSKPANQLCGHSDPVKGCRIYADRPALCRAFLCSWMKKLAMHDSWQPMVCHMLVYEQGPQITVLVDPAHPDAWTRPAYFAQLEQWAADVEPAGGFVIVFVGDEAVKIMPGLNPPSGKSIWHA
ncbi:hypothetical protein [Pararhizobium sp.]|uniref:hypothetical protein n=1 Tax=Pararhizobium sp. TaxID=1977563 RepID=UPI0027279002|nr:hypothetical protein [Pararhizobium sp.]MDO9415578.1 hypothetical protein [Pararhizobium sp.]